MLIVNADDFGFSRSVTDPVIAAYDEGLITSTSAMVWMPDSPRAATLARERDMPVGLHLNLTAPFGADRVPQPARELQAQLTNMFDASSWNEDDVRPRQLDPRIQEAIQHQLDAFREQFGEPTHIDGHHHVHVHPAVLPCLPPDLPVRPVLRVPGRLSEPPDRREQLLREHFAAPDACVGFQHVHPALGGAGFDVLSYSRRHVLEVMVHTQIETESLALRSSGWTDALARLELGSYRGLRR